MKTKEKLNTQKEEVETESKKLHELTDEELAQVTGGGKRIFALTTKSWFFAADLHAEAYPGQVKVNVIRESKTGGS